MRIAAIGQGLTGLGGIDRELLVHSSRLASGKRITKAADDAAGLAIVEKMRAELASLDQASRNVDHGVAVTRIADGAMASQGDNLVRMRELAMQAANGTLSDSDRQTIQSEMSALRDEIDRVSESTSFNGKPLLAGDTVEIQVGTTATGSLPLDTPDTSATALGLNVDVSTVEGARDALATIDAASEQLSAARGDLGAAENRLNYAADEIGSRRLATAASHSRIADADIGGESSGLASATLRMQAAIAMQKKSHGLQGLLVSALG